MKIQKYTHQHGNDFSAIMECEHCGHTGENKYGYHDGFYHDRVIPQIFCASCGKNREGSTVKTDDAVNGETRI
jgi:hypothetical protein